MHLPHNFNPMRLSCRLICFSVGAFKDDFRFDLLLVKFKEKLKRQIVKPRRKFDTIPGLFNGELNAALASFYVFVSQRSVHLIYFPISLFHSPSLDAWLPRQQHSGQLSATCAWRMFQVPFVEHFA